MRVAAPCRVDLAGGTLDIWPIGLIHPGSLTVNIAIPVEVALVVDLAGEPGSVRHTTPEGEVRRFSREQATTDLSAAVAFSVVPHGGVRIRVLSQAPFRSGIGGSSSYGIALVRALTELVGRAPAEHEMVALIRDLEARILGVPTGEQDHWAAVRGGVLALHLEAGGNRVETLDVAPGWLSERMTVFFSGIRHRSGMVNWQVIRRRLDGDAATTAAFDEVAAAAGDCRAALLAQDEDAVGMAIRRDWKARRLLAPEVCTVELGELIGAALGRGATAVKACGAGGGGSIVVWHPVGTRTEIISALENTSSGGRVLATSAATEGVRPIPES